MPWSEYTRKIQRRLKKSIEKAGPEVKVFTLTQSEYNNGLDWIKKKYEKHLRAHNAPEGDAFDQGPPVYFEWRFVNTGIGQKCTVYDSLDKEEYDITDYSIW